MENRTNLTPKELWLIEAIVSNEFTSNNYYLPSHLESFEEARAGEGCWTFSIGQSGAKHGEKVSGKALSGVVASANKKGYVISNEAGRDSTVQVTREGWKAYQEAMEIMPKEVVKTINHATAYRDHSDCVRLVSADDRSFLKVDDAKAAGYSILWR